MPLKNHLIEVFKKASSENNILLKENIVLKWVHRFGIDSLNDLLIHFLKFLILGSGNFGVLIY